MAKRGRKNNKKLGKKAPNSKQLVQTTAENNKVGVENDMQRAIQMENDLEALKHETETLKSRFMRLQNQREFLNTLSAEEQHELIIEIEETNNAIIILNRKTDEFSKVVNVLKAYLLAKYPSFGDLLMQQI